MMSIYISRALNRRRGKRTGSGGARRGDRREREIDRFFVIVLAGSGDFLFRQLKKRNSKVKFML